MYAPLKLILTLIVIADGARESSKANWVSFHLTTSKQHSSNASLCRLAILDSAFVDHDVLAHTGAKLQRVAVLDLVVARGGNFFRVDLASVGRLQVDNVRSAERDRSVCYLSRKGVRNETYLMRLFWSPNSLVSIVCRNWMTACCFEHDGWSSGMSTTVRSRPSR